MTKVYSVSLDCDGDYYEVQTLFTERKYAEDYCKEHNTVEDPNAYSVEEFDLLDKPIKEIERKVFINEDGILILKNDYKS